ncbi:hypothetical protein C8Q78DRAFT_1020787 [Trametes maxima]|nr:hypothetical protein C8Q78DRAFT_1020787 [Trametes maxima]
MSLVLDLPYDILQDIFTYLTAVEVLHFIRVSRKLYYPLIDDGPTWRTFCVPYGITDTSAFGGRSLRTVYGLLHRYGALLGLWCSDYPFTGNIIEFRLVQDNWLRQGETIIVGDVWEFTEREGTPRPYYPKYTEFMQIGFTPPDQSTPDTENDVQISWHIRSERDLGFIDTDDTSPPWIRMDRGKLATPSIHVIVPSTARVVFYTHLASPITIPEMLASAPWYDSARGVPGLPQLQDLPPLKQESNQWWRSLTSINYTVGAMKPATIAFIPPPHDQESDVRLPDSDLHRPRHFFSDFCTELIPRYFPLRYRTLEGDDPASPHWHPQSMVGLWLGDYGVHGTECLFIEYTPDEAALRAWKVVGDPNVPRGVCSWEANIQLPAPAAAGVSRRAYQGLGTLARRGFRCVGY